VEFAHAARAASAPSDKAAFRPAREIVALVGKAAAASPFPCWPLLGLLPAESSAPSADSAVRRLDLLTLSKTKCGSGAVAISGWSFRNP